METNLLGVNFNILASITQRFRSAVTEKAVMANAINTNTKIVAMENVKLENKTDGVVHDSPIKLDRLRTP